MSKIFSSKIYKEGLRQGKIVGLTYIGLMVLLVLGTFVSYLMPGRILTYAANLPEIFLNLPFWVVVPVLCLTMFNFMNNRAGSDYYHAFPQNRTVFFFSFLSSILTWAVIGLLILIIPFMLVDLIFNGSAYLGGWVTNFIYSVTGCLQVAGAVLLAMSISSTLIGQVSVTGMILFLPRAIISFTYNTMTARMFMIPSDGFRGIGILDHHLNIAFGSVVDVNRYYLSGWSPSLWPVLYTFILAVPMIVLAWLLYKRRKSEAAGQPAVNKWAQSAIAAFISFCVCAYGQISALDTLLGEGLARRRNLFNALIFLLVYFLLSLLVYFVYQAVSARSFKAVTKALPGLGILIGLNIIFAAACMISVNSVLTFNPAAEDISYILYENPSSIWNLGKNWWPTYADVMASEIRFTDEFTISTISDRLEKDADRFVKMKDIGYNFGYARVKVVTKSGREVTRIVTFPQYEFRRITEIRQDNKDFMDALRSLPPKSLLDDKIFEYSNYHLTNDQIWTLWDIYYDERTGMGDRYLLDNYDQDRNCPLFEYIEGIYNFTGKVNGRFFSDRIEITTQATKTAAQYIVFVNGDAFTGKPATFDGMMEYLKMRYEEAVWIYGYNYRDAEGAVLTLNSYGWNFLDLQNYARLLKELEDNWDKAVAPEKPFFKLGYWDGENYHCFYVQANEADSCMASWVYIPQVYIPDYDGVPVEETVSQSDQEAA